MYSRNPKYMITNPPPVVSQRPCDNQTELAHALWPPGRVGSGAQHDSFRLSVRRTSSALSAPKGVSPYKTADNRRRDGISQIRRKWVNQWPYIAAIVTSEHGTAIGWRVTPVSGLQRPYLAIFGPKSTKMADFDGAKSTYRPAR